MISEFPICFWTFRNSPLWYHIPLAPVHWFDSKPLPFWCYSYSYSPHQLHSTNSHTKQWVLTLSPLPCLWPACGYSLNSWSAIVAPLPLLGNFFNEQHWNLVNIVFMMAKPGNMFQTQKFVSGKGILLLSSKICFHNKCFMCGETGKHLPRPRCFCNNIS